MRRFAILAHYDPQGRVKRYVEHHLRALREVSQAVWFVSSVKLSHGELAKAEALTERAWTRDNVGFDFGMWREALEGIDARDWDEVILTNSSVFGPLWPLRESFEKMQSAPSDVWGMTDNAEAGWHLQSYFLVLRSRWLRDESFRRFWRDVKPFTDKGDVIRNYEIGLSAFLAKEGFEAEALVPGDTLGPRPLLHHLQHPTLFNPTLLQPLALLERRMPYVKVELLRDNPMNQPLAPVLRAIERSGYDTSLLDVSSRRDDRIRSK